jgi:hypothetical protein
VSPDHRSNEQPSEGFCVHYDRHGKLTYVDLPLDFDESDRAVLHEILKSPPQDGDLSGLPYLALTGDVGAGQGHRPHPR